MLARFVAATVVSSVAVALLTLMYFGAPSALGLNLERMAPLLALWCIAPPVWGLWAMATPRAWFPQRLPVWGTFLGMIAGYLGMFVLNLPARVFGLYAPVWRRGIASCILAVFYYVLWILVRRVYVRLTSAHTVGK